MKEKNDVEVLINGRKYTICGFESAEYLQKIATYINSKYTEFKGKDYYYSLDVELRNILLAINIADDYFKAEKEHKSVVQENERKDKMVLDMKHEVLQSESQSEQRQAQSDELRARCEKAEKEVVAWNVKCQDLAAKANSLEERLAQSETENAANVARLEDSHDQVAILQKEKAELESRIESLNKQLKTQQSKAKKKYDTDMDKLTKSKDAEIDKLVKEKDAEIAKLTKSKDAEVEKAVKEKTNAVAKELEQVKKDAEETSALLDEYADENEELKSKLETAERRVSELESKGRRRR